MNMWASLSVGEFTKSLEMDNDIMSIIASSLSSHPLVDDTIAKSIASQTLIITEESVPQPIYAEFCPTGEGWFEDKLGKSATQIVKDLRKARRVFKGSREEIDLIIDNVRKIKSMEVDATLKKLDWSNGYESTVRDLGVSEKDLKSLRLFGNTRKSSLVRACNAWDAAIDALHKLDEFEDVLGEEERN